MEDTATHERQVRAARNQSLFRAVNESLEGLCTAFQRSAHSASFICECADVECTAPLELELDEYEALREHGNRYAVLPGHVLPEVERVVSENDRFVVVAKLGAGAEVANAGNPREPVSRDRY